MIIEIIIICTLLVCGFNRIDISKESVISSYQTHTGRLGEVELRIIKLPHRLTVQMLDDSGVSVWKGTSTEALRELNMYFINGEIFGLYLYSIDYFSSPNETYFLCKKGQWKRVSKEKFDYVLFDKSLLKKMGVQSTFAHSNLSLIYLLIILQLLMY
ncbi:putative integral membrane protein [Theileria parva strain Muguga]|uniref:putative integral membrane protein n=1 Tax=Theileria parva strain Muguga TaxID=333668 RepID=UPI001C61FD37|nr:putative integral membrane protein [Theileria parva strain Muguga]KAF5153197.1 putative integral membrane protein [Theileria parva strain Muguga]